MTKKDEKKLEVLTNKIIKLMDKIYEAQKELNQLENESDTLLRKLLNRDANKR